MSKDPQLCGCHDGYMEPECNTCGINRGWVNDEEDGGTMSCPECDGDSGLTCELCDDGWIYPDELDLP